MPAPQIFRSSPPCGWEVPPSTLLSPEGADELAETALKVWATGDEWLLIGGGSNLIVADEGFDGTAIRVITRGIEQLSDVPVRLRVQAGESWDDVVDYAVERGWRGIEALSGIPGSCGAAPMQNIGAYGQELSDSLVAVDFLDYLTGVRRWLPAEELELGYRTSALKQGREGVVIALELQLTPSARWAERADRVRPTRRRPRGGGRPASTAGGGARRCARPARLQGDAPRTRRSGFGQRRLLLHQPHRRRKLRQGAAIGCAQMAAGRR